MMKKIVSLFVAEIFLCSSILPAWAQATDFLRPKVTMQSPLLNALKQQARDGGDTDVFKETPGPLPQLVEKLMKRESLTPSEFELLKRETLLDRKQREVFGITPENVEVELRVRIDLFQRTVYDFQKLMEKLEVRDLTPEIFWSIYIPLSLWLYRRKLAKRPDEAYIVGFYGGIGIGKTTRTQILTLVLTELLKERGERVVVFSIDDLYKTKAERELLKTKGYTRRGPPGTHDVQLGVRVLHALRKTTDSSVVELPVFQKETDDRRPEPRIILGKVGIVIFEGWIVGTNTNVDPKEVQPGFKREVAQALKEYEALNAELDDLITRLLRPLHAIKAMYTDQVHRQRARHERRGGVWTGLQEHEIDPFVDSLYEAPWDWVNTFPDPRPEDTSIQIITDNQRRIIEMLLGDRGKPRRFAKQVVVVTGGGSGLGRVISGKIAEEHGSVAMVGRHAEALEETADALRRMIANHHGENRVLVVPGDVGYSRTVQNLYRQVQGKWGHLDAIVNNAGTSGAFKYLPWMPYTERSPLYPDEELAPGTIRNHLIGTWFNTREAFWRMLDQESGIIMQILTFFTQLPIELQHLLHPYYRRTPYTVAQGRKAAQVKLAAEEARLLLDLKASLGLSAPELRDRVKTSSARELLELRETLRRDGKLIRRGQISVVGTRPGPFYSTRIYGVVYPRAAEEEIRVQHGPEDHSLIALAGRIVRSQDQEGSNVSTAIEEAIQGYTKAHSLTSGEAILTARKQLGDFVVQIQKGAEAIQETTQAMHTDLRLLDPEVVAGQVVNQVAGEAHSHNGEILSIGGLEYKVGSIQLSLPTSLATLPDLSGKVAVFSLGLFATKQNLSHLLLVAQYFAQAGATLVLVGPTEREKTLSQLAEQVRSQGGLAMVKVGRITNEPALKQLFQSIRSDLGGFDILIHWAGDSTPRLSLAMSDQAIQQNSQNYDLLPMLVAKTAVNTMAPPAAEEDPRLFKEAKGILLFVGPSLPEGKGISTLEQAWVEFNRGGLGPLIATNDAEQQWKLKSNIRIRGIFPGHHRGRAVDPKKLALAALYLVSPEAKNNVGWLAYPDEQLSGEILLPERTEGTEKSAPGRARDGGGGKTDLRRKTKDRRPVVEKMDQQESVNESASDGGTGRFLSGAELLPEWQARQKDLSFQSPSFSGQNQNPSTKNRIATTTKESVIPSGTFKNRSVANAAANRILQRSMNVLDKSLRLPSESSAFAISATSIPDASQTVKKVAPSFLNGTRVRDGGGMDQRAENRIRVLTGKWYFMDRRFGTVLCESLLFSLGHMRRYGFDFSNLELIGISGRTRRSMAKHLGRYLDAVLINLFENALEAMGERPIQKLTIETGTEAGYDFLRISDAGPGVLAEHLERIWDRDFTMRGPLEERGRGLTHTRKVVERYGGTIAVQSEPGRGATFTVRFPVAEGAPQRSPARDGGGQEVFQKAVHTVPAAHRNPKILSPLGPLVHP